MAGGGGAAANGVGCAVDAAGLVNSSSKPTGCKGSGLFTSESQNFTSSDTLTVSIAMRLHYEYALVKIGLARRDTQGRMPKKIFGKIRQLSNDMNEIERRKLINAAKEMIRLHGYIASAHAGMRSVKALAIGDMDKFHFWKRVSDTIQELQRGTHTPK